MVKWYTCSSFQTFSDRNFIFFNDIAENCEDFDLRLVGGKDSSEGRVEVCYNNVWGSVCNHHWDTDDARVVCRQLGLDTGQDLLFAVTKIIKFVATKSVL